MQCRRSKCSLPSYRKARGQWISCGRNLEQQTRNAQLQSHHRGPMLGTMIESCGDTLDESHMPLGWPMSIDGAVRQFCMHKQDTIQELNGILAEFNLQRSSVEINRNTSHNSVWNKKYTDPYPGYTLQQLWDALEHCICRKASRSREVTEEAILGRPLPMAPVL